MSEADFETDCEIAAAAPEDVPAIYEMILGLAKFEKLEHQLQVTEERLLEAFFGESPCAEALVAKVSQEVVGYAVLFQTFSTFVGKPGMWLEDLYVHPDHRRKGIGKALLKAGGDRARECGCGRYEWSVLDWNRNAIDIYEAMGASVLEDWRFVRLDRGGIEALEDK